MTDAQGDEMIRLLEQILSEIRQLSTRSLESTLDSINDNIKSVDRNTDWLKTYGVRIDRD